MEDLVGAGLGGILCRSMPVREGIPTLAEMEGLVCSSDFALHRVFNDAFLARHAPRLRRYARWWGRDPLSLWSRRWEYPFAAERILEFCEARAGNPVRLLDAGSGVTYLPFFLCERAANLTAVCCDSNIAYGRMIASISDERGLSSRIRFEQGTLQRLPEPDGSIDAVCCLSVLEHTSDYASIIGEFARVLRTGGLLLLSFDISLDGKFQVQPDEARALLEHARRDFEIRLDIPREFGRLRAQGELLTTDYYRRHAPQLLPFTHPWLLAGYDLVRGYGWTTGFRSATVICLAGVRHSCALGAGAGVERHVCAPAAGVL